MQVISYYRRCGVNNLRADQYSSISWPNFPCNPASKFLCQANFFLSSSTYILGCDRNMNLVPLPNLLFLAVRNEIKKTEKNAYGNFPLRTASKFIMMHNSPFIPNQEWKILRSLKVLSVFLWLI